MSQAGRGGAGGKKETPEDVNKQIQQQLDALKKLKVYAPGDLEPHIDFNKSPFFNALKTKRDELEKHAADEKWPNELKKVALEVWDEEVDRACKDFHRDLLSGKDYNAAALKDRVKQIGDHVRGRLARDEQLIIPAFKAATQQQEALLQLLEGESKGPPSAELKSLKDRLTNADTLKSQAEASLKEVKDKRDKSGTDRDELRRVFEELKASAAAEQSDRESPVECADQTLRQQRERDREMRLAQYARRENYENTLTDPGGLLSLATAERDTALSELKMPVEDARNELGILKNEHKRAVGPAKDDYQRQVSELQSKIDRFEGAEAELARLEEERESMGMVPGMVPDGNTGKSKPGQVPGELKKVIERQRQELAQIEGAPGLQAAFQAYQDSRRVIAQAFIDPTLAQPELSSQEQDLDPAEQKRRQVEENKRDRNARIYVMQNVVPQVEQVLGGELQRLGIAAAPDLKSQTEEALKHANSELLKKMKGMGQDVKVDGSTLGEKLAVVESDPSLPARDRYKMLMEIAEQHQALSADADKDLRHFTTLVDKAVKIGDQGILQEMHEALKGIPGVVLPDPRDPALSDREILNAQVGVALQDAIPKLRASLPDAKSIPAGSTYKDEKGQDQDVAAALTRLDALDASESVEKFEGYLAIARQLQTMSADPQLAALADLTDRGLEFCSQPAADKPDPFPAAFSSAQIVGDLQALQGNLENQIERQINGHAQTLGADADKALGRYLAIEDQQIADHSQTKDDLEDQAQKRLRELEAEKKGIPADDLDRGNKIAAIDKKISAITTQMGKCQQADKALDDAVKKKDDMLKKINKDASAILEDQAIDQMLFTQRALRNQRELLHSAELSPSYGISEKHTNWRALGTASDPNLDKGAKYDGLAGKKDRKGVELESGRVYERDGTDIKVSYSKSGDKATARAFGGKPVFTWTGCFILENCKANIREERNMLVRTGHREMDVVPPAIDQFKPYNSQDQSDLYKIMNAKLDVFAETQVNMYRMAHTSHLPGKTTLRDKFANKFLLMGGRLDEKLYYIDHDGTAKHIDVDKAEMRRILEGVSEPGKLGLRHFGEPCKLENVSAEMGMKGTKVERITIPNTSLLKRMTNAIAAGIEKDPDLKKDPAMLDANGGVCPPMQSLVHINVRETQLQIEKLAGEGRLKPGDASALVEKAAAFKFSQQHVEKTLKSEAQKALDPKAMRKGVIEATDKQTVDADPTPGSFGFKLADEKKADLAVGSATGISRVSTPPDQTPDKTQTPVKTQMPDPTQSLAQTPGISSQMPTRTEQTPKDEKDEKVESKRSDKTKPPKDKEEKSEFTVSSADLAVKDLIKSVTEDFAQIQGDEKLRNDSSFQAQSIASHLEMLIDTFKSFTSKDGIITPATKQQLQDLINKTFDNGISALRDCSAKLTDGLEKDVRRPLQEKGEELAKQMQAAIDSGVVPADKGALFQKESAEFNGKLLPVDEPAFRLS